MMRKALPYTLAKAGCLLSGTSFYIVSLSISYAKERSSLTHVVNRLGILKVNIQASSTSGAPMPSFTS
jgi:hypothetical protein